ncbi:MAG: 50S ribosomal protein L29 [Firmicutes bacterium]|nr:50S ribosomal protein L29 [Bacillota bacterium]
MKETTKKLADKTSQELNAQLKELKSELFNLRFQNATGQLANPKQISACKKEIARVKTMIREQELKG